MIKPTPVSTGVYYYLHTMKYLFKTVEVNHYGTASFEVFEKEDDVYLFMPVTYKGYGAKPSKLEIKIIKDRYISTPSNHPFQSNLVETLRLYLY